MSCPGQRRRGDPLSASAPALSYLIVPVCLIFADVEQFNKTVVTRYKGFLKDRELAPGTMNVRLAAVRRLAYKAADAGLLSPELAAGISRVRGARKLYPATRFRYKMGPLSRRNLRTRHDAFCRQLQGGDLRVEQLHKGSQSLLSFVECVECP
jgi:hypothetical protein